MAVAACVTFRCRAPRADPALFEFAAMPDSATLADAISPAIDAARLAVALCARRVGGELFNERFGHQRFRVGKRIRDLVLGISLLVGGGYAISLLPQAPESAEQMKERETRQARLDAQFNSTPEQRSAWGRALRRAGWNCPDVKKIWWRGEDAKGNNAKVMCGPAGISTDVYADRIFNVTMRPSGVLEAKQGSLYD